jgi:SAM-dependent methyltransferase
MNSPDFWKKRDYTLNIGAENRARFLASKVGDGAVVLNIGAGPGILESLLLKKSCVVDTVDPSLEAAQKAAVSEQHAFQGSITELPKREGGYDYVVCGDVFEHIPMRELRKGIGHIRSVLKPDGTLLVTVPYKENIKKKIRRCVLCGGLHHPVGHYHSFDEKRLSWVVSQHFKMDAYKVYYPSPLLQMVMHLNWKGKVISPLVSLARRIQGTEQKSLFMRFSVK